MNLDKIHIFILLMLALICSSCLGSFMREGYENSNENKYPNVEQDQTMNPDPEDNSKLDLSCVGLLILILNEF